MESRGIIRIQEFSSHALPTDLEVSAFVEYLNEVWINRLILQDDVVEDSDPVTFQKDQPFLHFTHDQKLKASNYVGFIRWNGLEIEIIPKVLKPSDHQHYWKHLFFWLTYCRRVRFPFSKINGDSHHIDSLPESLIYSFAKYTQEVIGENPYLHYEEISETAQVLKGRLNIKSYINQEFARGNQHKLVMDFEPFIHDNLLNRIIKFVATLLQFQCRFSDTYIELQKILFHLDDISDINITARDCDNVKINRLFDSYQQVLDMCRFFLSDTYLNRETGPQQNFSFLVPMEYIFEDFLAGFLEENLKKDYRLTYQSGGYLTDQKVFRTKNDIFISNRITKTKLIIDAKYKLRQPKPDGKKGIQQSDLYQMVSYALKRNCNKVLLLYPQHEGSSLEIDHFTVSSELIPVHFIHVFAADIPFVFEVPGSPRAKEELLTRLTELINHIEEIDHVKIN